jgi:hypothetical protein
MQMRGALLLAALAITVAAVYFAPPAEEDAVVLPAGRQSAVTGSAGQSRPAAPPSIGTAKANQDIASLRPRAIAPEKDFDLFASQSWTPPVPKAGPPTARPQPEPEAPPPTAPPAPIKLLGRYEEAGTGGVAVFALFNDQNVVLRAGETVGTDWRVDAIEGNQVVLTYLPLGQKQNLPWAAAP